MLKENYSKKQIILQDNKFKSINLLNKTNKNFNYKIVYNMNFKFNNSKMKNFKIYYLLN